MGFPRSRAFDYELACRVGLNETLFLSQLDFWLTNSDYGIEIDGKRYIVNSYAKWHGQFEYWSERTVKTVILKCVNAGYVESVKAGDGYNQTRGYRIVYSHPAFSSGQELPNPLGKNDPIQSEETAQSSLEEHTKKTKEPVSGNGTGQQPEATVKVDEAMEKFTGAFSLEEALLAVEGKEDHGPSVGTFWLQCMVGFGHVIGTQKVVSNARKKKLRYLFAAVVDGPRKLANALGHWNAYRDFCLENYDFKLPVRPTVEKIILVPDALNEFQPPEAVKADEGDFMTIEEALQDL